MGSTVGPYLHGASLWAAGRAGHGFAHREKPKALGCPGLERGCIWVPPSRPSPRSEGPCISLWLADGKLSLPASMGSICPWHSNGQQLPCVLTVTTQVLGLAEENAVLPFPIISSVGIEQDS